MITDEYVCIPARPYDIIGVLNQMMPVIIQLVIIFGILYVVKSILSR